MKRKTNADYVYYNGGHFLLNILVILLRVSLGDGDRIKEGKKHFMVSNYPF